MDSQIIEASSYAKINLFLHITKKRDDGYHNLQTWFQFVDLKDNLSFKVNNYNQKLSIYCTQKFSSIENNLVYKAAMALKKFAKVQSGLDIIIDKNIPIGGGLGGGSSNAATTLKILNQLWKCDLDQKKLMSIASSIGADVPIFIFSKSAWAEGIGDILIEKPYVEQYALIIKPLLHSSTSRLFNHKKLNRSKSYLDHKKIKTPKKLENIFQPIIISEQPRLESLFSKLPDFPQLKMTGTGSCFFLLNRNIERLRQNQKKLEKAVDSWIVKTLNFSSV